MRFISNESPYTQVNYNITAYRRGPAWLGRLVWDQDVAGSNPVAGTEG